MTAPILAAALVFHLPLMQARGCGAGPDSLHDALTWRVSVRQQSPAWIAMRPAMLADAGVWAALWPIVRAEAEPVVYARIPLDPNTDAGRRVRFTVTDTTGGPWFYFVTVTNEAAKVSRQSNECGR